MYNIYIYIYIYIIVVKVYQYCWLYIPSINPLSQPGTVEAVAVARAVAGASLDVTGATVPALLADALLMDALSTSDEGTCRQNLCALGENHRINGGSSSAMKDLSSSFEGSQLGLHHPTLLLFLFALR